MQQSEFITRSVAQIDMYLGELRGEEARLEAARAALTNGHAPKRRGRPPASKTKTRRTTAGRRKRTGVTAELEVGSLSGV